MNGSTGHGYNCVIYLLTEDMSFKSPIKLRLQEWTSCVKLWIPRSYNWRLKFFYLCQTTNCDVSRLDKLSKELGLLGLVPLDEIWIFTLSRIPMCWHFPLQFEERKRIEKHGGSVRYEVGEGLDSMLGWRTFRLGCRDNNMTIFRDHLYTIRSPLCQVSF
jgi:hypothetical protein